MGFFIRHRSPTNLYILECQIKTLLTGDKISRIDNKDNRIPLLHYSYVVILKMTICKMCRIHAYWFIIEKILDFLISSQRMSYYLINC